jgi:hypothetical protein
MGPVPICADQSLGPNNIWNNVGLCIGVVLSFVIEWFERRKRMKALDTEGG